MRNCDLPTKLLQFYSESKNAIHFNRTKKSCNAPAMVFITSLATKLLNISAKIPSVEAALKNTKGWDEFVKTELVKIREREDHKIGEDAPKRVDPKMYCCCFFDAETR